MANFCGTFMCKKKKMKTKDQRNGMVRIDKRNKEHQCKTSQLRTVKTDGTEEVELKYQNMSNLKQFYLVVMGR